jgi:hypothetical protein
LSLDASHRRPIDDVVLVVHAMPCGTLGLWVSATAVVRTADRAAGTSAAVKAIAARATHPVLRPGFRTWDSTKSLLRQD